MRHTDTIAAIATAPGPAAVGIVRLSGPDALAIADALFRAPSGGAPRTPLSQRPTHTLHHGKLVDPRGAPLDDALVLLMRGPKSFTGEDVVELQTHGGAWVPRAVLQACLATGARLAAPGEFTKRAFLNGKLDLAQAEAVADLVEAKGERALAQALAQLDGALSRQVAGLRSEVIALLARLEAAIDYPDEIEDLPAADAEAAIAGLLNEVAKLVATRRQGELFREGAQLAIVGRPNVGKSSLLNALLGRERALVTDIPGTTRDVLEEALVLDGLPFRLADTAGLRETADVVEAMGVARARALAADADVVLLVVDLATGIGPAELALRAELADRPLVVVGNKSDLAAADGLEAFAAGAPHVALSAATGAGLDGLIAALVEAALGLPLAAAAPAAVNARHAASLVAAAGSLANALASARAGLPGDFLAIDLAAAAATLGEVAGDALNDEVIDEVFSRFCVGK